MKLADFVRTVAPRLPSPHVPVGEIVRAFNISRQETTIEQVRQRLLQAQEKVGEGRFNLTINASPDEVTGPFYLTHWFRPTPDAFEDCRCVGNGTLTQVLTALDLYVSAYHRTSFTLPELADTLGLPA